MVRSGWFSNGVYPAVVGVCTHAAQLPAEPPYRRQEHAPDTAPVLAIDQGATLIVTQVTSGFHQHTVRVW